jgi:hypothetical protein
MDGVVLNEGRDLHSECRLPWHRLNRLTSVLVAAQKKNRTDSSASIRSGILFSAASSYEMGAVLVHANYSS